MNVIPLVDAPSQTLQIVLGGQACTLNIYSRASGLYCDVQVNNVAIISGVLCTNLNFIVRDTYLGFIGDLSFNDTQGLSDPSYPGLGTRYELWYITP